MSRKTLLVFIIISTLLLGCMQAPTATPAATAETQSLETDGETTSSSDLESISCSGELTSPNMEGPYYKTGSPERSSMIEEGMPGTPILIQGGVYDQDCSPIAGAKVDLWQTDANGDYDNSGYMLRGHVFTDENGMYAIETIEPGVYPGRPPHIHVKVFAPDGQELLTTQMYFPGSEGSADVRNAPDLSVTYNGTDEQGRRQVIFNFVVRD